MHVFQPYPIESIEIDPFTKLDKEWAEVVTKNGKGANAMTVSWGGFGTMFNKPVATLYVRESRYTRELLDQDGHFSLCFLDEKYKKEMGFLGNVSGRDENKIAESRLHVGLFDDVPYIDEANLVIVCRTIAKTPLPVEDVIDKGYAEKFYPTGDFHNIYICEIEKIYAR